MRFLSAGEVKRERERRDALDQIEGVEFERPKESLLGNLSRVVNAPPAESFGGKPVKIGRRKGKGRKMGEFDFVDYDMEEINRRVLG